MPRRFLPTRTRPRLAVRGGAAPDALARAVADGAAALLATVLGKAVFGVLVVDGVVALALMAAALGQNQHQSAQHSTPLLVLRLPPKHRHRRRRHGNKRHRAAPCSYQAH